MGLLDSLKNKLNSSNRKAREEELNGYLKSTKDNLKVAYDNIGRFLEGTRDFQPARRHEELYHDEVKNRLVGMRASMRNGLIFLDERMNNTVNTMNHVKSPNQLKDLMSGWIKSIQANDDKAYDILKILQVEMWGTEKISRGFPAPTNRELLCGYLVSAASSLNESRNQIDLYITMSNVPISN